MGGFTVAPRVIVALALCAPAATAAVRRAGGDACPTDVARVFGPAIPAAQPTNPTAAVLERFQARVQEYLSVKKKAEATLPPAGQTDDPGAITARQQALAVVLRRARAGAKRGDIFIPGSAPIFKKLVAADFTGRTLSERRAALKEVPAVHLEPGDQYPETLPLATVPAKLLARLPRLPDGLEYRFAGEDLIIRDSDANLVVDVLDDAIPRQ